MRRAVARQIPGVVLVVWALAPGPAFSQARPEATAVLSARTVPLGDTFELRVSGFVPPRSAVYFPGELPATDAIESHGPVRWEARASADGATLALTYPLIALGTGNLEVQAPAVLIVPLDDAGDDALSPGGGGSIAGGDAPSPGGGGPIAGGDAPSPGGDAPIAGGSVVGAWDEAPGGDRASRLLAGTPMLEVRIASIFQLEGVLAGVGPMPAADVVGRNWHLPSLVLLLVSSIVSIGVLAAHVRRWLRSRAARDGAGVTTGSALEEARRTALKDLDALLARGLHTNGRTREFYTLSSDIVRRYLLRLDARWQPGLTSTELMRDLGDRMDSERLNAFSAEMIRAEVVKFGQLRPGREAAEAHWRTLRKWIDEHGSGIREH